MAVSCDRINPTKSKVTVISVLPKRVIRVITGDSN